MGWQGVDIRQTGELLMFRCLLQDSGGVILASGTTSLRLYELQADESLKSYDFNDNTFKSTALTTSTLAMGHRKGNNNTFDTGLWTVKLANLTGFTVGKIYEAHVTNTGAFPSVQIREFQFGGGQGANLIQIAGDAQSATNLKDFADDGYDPATHKLEAVKAADNMRGTDGANTVGPDNAGIAAAAAAASAAASAATAVAALLNADRYIDTAPTPWQLVLIEAGTGGLGVGNELLRQDLFDITGDDVDAITTFVARSVAP